MQVHISLVRHLALLLSLCCGTASTWAEEPVETTGGCDGMGCNHRGDGLAAPFTEITVGPNQPSVYIDELVLNSASDVVFLSILAEGDGDITLTVIDCCAFADILVLKSKRLGDSGTTASINYFAVADRDITFNASRAVEVSHGSGSSGVYPSGFSVQVNFTPRTRPRSELQAVGETVQELVTAATTTVARFVAGR